MWRPLPLRPTVCLYMSMFIYVCVFPTYISTNRGVRVYTRRWYCLFLYALLCFILGLVSNTFGPIAHAAEIAFNWTDADIALLSNWQPLGFIFSVPLMAWVIDTKGTIFCVPHMGHRH